MFIGHFAVAFAAKKTVPRTSLGTLFMAVQFVDLLWPLLLLLGLEHVRIDPGNTAFTPLDFYDYPVSHSLLGVLGWSLLFAVISYGVRRNQKTALVLGACIASHWVLDALTHRPDLPLAPGSSTMIGLGLWNSVAGTMIVEVLLFAFGVWIYGTVMQPKDKTGSYAFWGLIGFLILIYLLNIFGPPPPDASSIAWVGNASWLFVLWAYWIDQHQEPR